MLAYTYLCATTVIIVNIIEQMTNYQYSASANSIYVQKDKINYNMLLFGLQEI